MTAFHIIVLIAGIVSQYSPGVMEEVVANRVAWEQLPYPLPGVDGYVAVRDCDRIGDIMYLRPVGGEWEKFLVADCAMPPGTDGAWEWMTEYNILAEVDYWTAVRWKTVGSVIRAEVGIKVERGLMP